MKTMEITIQPFDASTGFFYIINDRGVTYKSNDLDNLIREFAIHSQHKAIKVGSVGLSVSNFHD